MPTSPLRVDQQGPHVRKDFMPFSQPFGSFMTGELIKKHFGIYQVVLNLWAINATLSTFKAIKIPPSAPLSERKLHLGLHDQGDPR